MALFTTAELRAFDKQQIASAVEFPDLACTNKAAELADYFARIFGVDIVQATHSDEVHDGDGSNYLLLDWPLIASVTSVTVDGVAFSGSEINPTDYGVGLAVDPRLPIITRRAGVFLSGWSNVMVTYVAGYATVPLRLKRAALQMAVNELPGQNTPWEATSYEAGGVGYGIGRADGYREQWFASPDGQAAFRAYSMKLPGVA
jgi:hypothetical protein